MAILKEIKKKRSQYQREGRKTALTWMRNAVEAVEKHACAIGISRSRPGDEETEKALRKHVKALNKGAAELRQLGGNELALSYENEAAAIEEFLPVKKATPGLEEAVAAAAEELGATGNPKMVGRVIGKVMKSSKGFDGAEVSEVAKQICQTQT